MTVKNFFNGLKVIIIFIILFFLSEMAAVSAVSIYFKYSNQGILWEEFVKNNSPTLTFIVQILRLIIIALFIYFRKINFMKNIKKIIFMIEKLEMENFQIFYYYQLEF